MGKKLDYLPTALQRFIADQKIYFVATAAEQGRVNLSPKGIDTFRIISENEVIWLNLTGSGNETQAHLAENNRMTIMFCAFEGAPNILRLYGQAKAILPNQTEWQKMIDLFPLVAGARQIIQLQMELVQTTCGYGVPFYEYRGERNTLLEWADKKGQNGIEEYWQTKNTVSLDGKKIDI